MKEDGTQMRLMDKSLTFREPGGREWTAPLGTLTDGASVPRAALSVTDGRWVHTFRKAAVLHDSYCRRQKGEWREVHKMFHDACLAGGTEKWLAKLMYQAVLLDGPKWEDPEAEKLLDGAGNHALAAAPRWTGEEDAPALEEIEKDWERRRPVLVRSYELERAVLKALIEGRPEQAAELLEKQNVQLDRELEKWPNDPMLLGFRGYWHKNRALLRRLADRQDLAEDELRRSEQTFREVLEGNPDDASALNGLGSVALLRGELERSECYIRRALEIFPDYEAARHDLALVLGEKRRRSAGS